MIRFIESRDDWAFIQLVEAGRDVDSETIVTVRVVMSDGQAQASFQLKSLIKLLRQFEQEIEKRRNT